MKFKTILSLFTLSTFLATIVFPLQTNAQLSSPPTISGAPGFLPFTLNVKSQGVTGDFQTFENGVMTSGSPTLTKNNGAAFTPASVGKLAIVTGALGVSSTPLASVILTYNSPTSVTLTDNATHSTSNAFLSGTSDIDISASTGNYVSGETLACTGGTTVAGANCVVRVYATQAVVNSVGNAGANATGSFCYLAPATGVGAPLIVRYAVVGGAISGAGTVISGGSYFTNPTTPAIAAMIDARAGTTSACNVTGVILNLSMTVTTLTVETVGEYSPTPSVAMTTGAGSTSGATGITFVGAWTTTGQGGWGTDDTVALKRAQDLSIAQFALGKRPVIYFPPGNYLVNGGAAGATSLSICDGPCSYIADVFSATALTVGPGYTGSSSGNGLLVWHNSWLGNDAPNTGGTLNFAASLFGASVANLQFVGFTTSTPEITALLFQGRNTGAQISNVWCSYLGSCLRAGILNGTSDVVANIQETEIYNLRTRLVGSATLPAVHLTAQNVTPGFSIAVPNNLNLIDINIYGSAKDGLVIDAVGPSVKSGGNNKGVNIRVEGVPRRGQVGAGDLFRIGDPTATTNVLISGISLSNVNLIGAIADTSGPTYYCGLRVASRYVSNVIASAVRITQASGGSDAACIDGGSNIQINFSILTSARYDINVGANPTVGTGLFFNMLDDPSRNSPYRWNIDASSLANINSNVIVKNNTVYISGLPTGNYNFAGNLTGNTNITFPLTGYLGSFTGTITSTTAVTWPATVNYIHVIAASQGGCGAGGAMETLGTVGTGGGGGGGGLVREFTYKRAELGNSTTFTIGTPCTPGLGATVNGVGAGGGVGANISWLLANSTTTTIYGGGNTQGGQTAASTSGGGGAGWGGAGTGVTAGAGVTIIPMHPGFAGGAGAAGLNGTINTGWSLGGAGGGGASITVGNKGGDAWYCPGGGSGGTLLAASAAAGGNGGASVYSPTASVGGVNTGGLGGAAVSNSNLYGGAAPGGGGGNPAGNGGNGGVTTGVPCVGGAGGGAGTARGGDGSASAPATLTYIAW